MIASDGPGTPPGLLIVADGLGPATQFDGSRKLATTIERGPDRGSLFLRDNEHLSSVKTLAAKSK